MKQAQSALKVGQRQKAHSLMQQAVRQDPRDHRAWLWLASTSASPRASLNYVKQAEKIRPDDPLVQKARAWAERRIQTTSNANGVVRPAIRPKDVPSHENRKWQTVVIWGGMAMLLAILLFLAGLFIVYSLGTQRQSIPTSQSAIGAAVDEDVAVRNEQAIRSGESVAMEAEPTATPLSTSPPALAKKIAGDGGDPRPTWTPTPSPTNTPVPSPTPIPTFVSPSWQKPAGRPLGVGPDERWIDVDLSEQTLYVYEGNDLIFETLISGGLPEYPTVTGQFRIWLRYESQTMDGRRLGYDYYLENVPYVMYFFEDYALHGTYWHNNFGTPMSHGCVNMRTEDAEWVFSWAGLGTVVNVHE
jgi:lipoprotein-anchoring transpeptidase ErfK/SrfK